MDLQISDPHRIFNESLYLGVNVTLASILDAAGNLPDNLHAFAPNKK